MSETGQPAESEPKPSPGAIATRVGGVKRHPSVLGRQLPASPASDAKRAATPARRGRQNRALSVTASPVESLPVLFVTGEPALKMVSDARAGPARYSKVVLPENASDDQVALAAERAARAIHHAAILARAGFDCVGVVRVQRDAAASLAPSCDLAALVAAASEEARALALPAERAGVTRAVVPSVGVVDAPAMFSAARGLLARHLALPVTGIDAMIFWCLHVWCTRGVGQPAFGFSPRLVLYADDARADHSRALRLVAWLTPRPVMVARAILRHLLEVIDALRPTLLLDDVEGGMLFRRDIRSLLAAGACRDGMILGRREGSTTRLYPCFAPMAIATRARLPEDVAARAVVVPMRPRPGEEALPSLVLTEPPPEVLLLRAQMCAFATQVDRAGFEEAKGAMPMRLSAASRECWQPLFAAARAIGPDAEDRADWAALDLAQLAPPPGSNLALLRDIQDILGPRPVSHVPTAKLIGRLFESPERPWAALRTDEGRVLRGYRGGDLAIAFSRYLSVGPSRKRFDEAELWRRSGSVAACLAAFSAQIRQCCV